MSVLKLEEIFEQFSKEELGIKGRILATGKEQVEKFLENPFPHRHMILLYDDQDYAKRLQYTFLKHSLQSGGSCCYVTHSGHTAREVIESEMKQFGINVNEASNTGFLHIEILPNFETFEGDIVKLIKEKVIANLTKLISPRRLVGIQGIPVCTENNINRAFKKEQFIRNKLEDLHTQKICPVNINDIEPSKFGSWIIKYLRYHDCVILSSGLDCNLVFELTSELPEGIIKETLADLGFSQNTTKSRQLLHNAIKNALKTDLGEKLAESTLELLSEKTGKSINELLGDTELFEKSLRLMFRKGADQIIQLVKKELMK